MGIPKSEWLKKPKTVDVVLLDTNTGLLHTITQEDFDAFDFAWSEGNYSCDCNRAAFCKIKSLLSESTPNYTYPCGDSRFIIVKCDAYPELMEITDAQS